MRSVPNSIDDKSAKTKAIVREADLFRNNAYPIRAKMNTVTIKLVSFSIHFVIFRLRLDDLIVNEENYCKPLFSLSNNTLQFIVQQYIQLNNVISFTIS